MADTEQTEEESLKLRYTTILQRRKEAKQGLNEAIEKLENARDKLAAAKEYVSTIEESHSRLRSQMFRKGLLKPGDE